MGVVAHRTLRSSSPRFLGHSLLGVSLLVLVSAAPVAAQRRSDLSKSLAPYVPSPPRVVEVMLEAANIKPDETVFDLGCGDGRVLITAAQRFKARAVGIEISETLVKAARENVKKAGLENRIQVMLADATTANVAQADVVTLYLLTHSNDMLRPNLEAQLKPGARVVSHDFAIPTWKPARVESCNVHGRNHRIYVYEMPQKK